MTGADEVSIRSFSPRQKEIVRKCLAAIREQGGPGADAASLYWAELAEEIVGGDETNYDKIGERLRRFVEGEPVGSGHFPDPEEPLASQVIRYLMHPEVNVLSREALNRVDVGYLEAKSFSEFLWQQAKRPEDEFAGLAGTYVCGYMDKDRRFIKTLEFQDSGHPYFAYVRESSFNVEIRARTMRRNGWATFTMDGEIHAFVVEVGTSIVDSFFGQVYDSEAPKNSAQVFFSGVPATNLERDALSIAQAYVNGNFRINAREPRQLFGKWSETERESINVYKFLGDVILGPPGVYDILLPGGRGPSWGPKRFYNKSTSETEVILNNDGKNGLETKDSKVPELILAFKECDQQRFEALVQSGADVNCREPGTKLTPLHYAAILGRQFELEVLRTRDDLDVLVRDHKGHLPSSHAVGLEDASLFLDLMREEMAEAQRRGISLENLGVLPPSDYTNG